MRSGGNRNSVTLSRMIKARFSRFVCPVAPYVSYFSFTSCQCSGVLFLHDAQRMAIWPVADCGLRHHPLLQTFVRGRILQTATSPAIGYIACCAFVVFIHSSLYQLIQSYVLVIQYHQNLRVLESLFESQGNLSLPSQLSYPNHLQLHQINYQVLSN